MILQDEQLPAELPQRGLLHPPPRPRMLLHPQPGPGQISPTSGKLEVWKHLQKLHPTCQVYLEFYIQHIQSHYIIIFIFYPFGFMNLYFRPYKVPSFEDIFETDHSSKSEQETESQQESQQVVLNLQSGGQAQSLNKRPLDLAKFSNVLSEYNRNSFSNPTSTSDILSNLSKKDYLHGAFFETTTKPYIQITSTQSHEEIRQHQLLELAREELRKKQLLKDKYIKAQQKHDNYMKIIQQHRASEKPLVKEPRSQQLDSFFSKVKGFNNNKNAQKKLNRELIKRYHEKLIKKSSQEKQYAEKLQQWKREKEVTKDAAKVSLISGQNFVDMSGGTIIMDSGVSQSPSRSNQPALHVTQRPPGISVSKCYLSF